MDSQLGILSIQRALQSTLFSADKMKIVVNMDGYVLFFDQSESVKLSFCSSTCPPHSLLLQFEKNPPDVSHFDLKSVQLPILIFGNEQFRVKLVVISEHGWTCAFFRPIRFHEIVILLKHMSSIFTTIVVRKKSTRCQPL